MTILILPFRLWDSGGKAELNISLDPLVQAGNVSSLRNS